MPSFSYLAILCVLLTACGQGGGEYEIARVTDPWVEAQVSEQRQQIEREMPGEVIDSLEWEQDGRRVFSVLSANDHPLDPTAGIYLHHYQIGVGGIRPLWQFMDTVDCREDRLHLDPVLTALSLSAPLGEEDTTYLVLDYELDCRPDGKNGVPARRLLLVHPGAGTPAYQINGFGRPAVREGEGDSSVGTALEWTSDLPVFAGAIANYDEVEQLPAAIRGELLMRWMNRID